MAWGGALLLVAALSTGASGANADPDESESVTSPEGAPEIRLDVPTSIAFDPFAEDSGGDAPVSDADPAVAPWTGIHDLPTPLFDNRLGTGYTLGGNDGTQVSDEMWWYSVALGDWVDDGGLPRPRQAPAIGTNRWGEMIMAGGWDEDGEPTAATHYYDPGSTWDRWFADMPSPRAAAGYASFQDDGATYVIGGCTTKECAPVSDSVFLLDDWWGDWSVVADYPVPVAFPSCGAWGERIYCTGGFDGTQAISDSYVYDRRAGSWSPLPDAPTDSWGTQHAMIDGTLIVNGGVQGGAVTNNTFGYDVTAGAWIELPNSNAAKYRGAGGCVSALGPDGRQFMSAGGQDGTGRPLAQAEILPGFTACYPPAGPAPVRISGANRYGTAAEVAKAWSPGVSVAYVASGDTFPDALAAASRAGVYDAPVLLTRHNSLPRATRDALTRLNPGRLVVVGGKASISSDVARALRPYASSGRVDRVAGANRYGTAAALAAYYPRGLDRVFLASGEQFPDALSAAARSGHESMPLLLTRAGRLPRATAARLQRLNPEEIVVIGGTAAVTTAVAEEAAAYATSGTYERVAGTNRYHTSAEVAELYAAPASPAIVASGERFPDAVVGAARAAHSDVPLVLTPKDRIDAGTDRALNHLDPTSMFVLGGPSTITWENFDRLGAYLP